MKPTRLSTSIVPTCAPCADCGPRAAARIGAWHARHPKSRAGFAMLEVLITMVILIVGLLGLAGLIARSSSAEMEALQRVQALVLVQDMVDRINANRKVAACYSAGSAGMQLGNVATTPALGCASGSAQQNAVAVADLNAWNSLLQGAAETSGGSQIGAMIGAVGCVKQLDPVNNIYLVSVAWQGLVATATPGDTCGQNLFGNDANRRDVSVTLRIATLT